MRVVLVAESFLPQMNGVVNSVLQMLDHLSRSGHETLVICPRDTHRPEPEALFGAGLAQLRSIPAPGYPQVRVAVASTLRLESILREFRPDVVHLASPFVLGWQALRAAERLGIPTVAVYQTDIPGYARRYGLPGLEPALDRHLVRIHNTATLTLAPSTAAIQSLAALGVDRVRLWARGVDGDRFHPSRRSDRWRREVAPGGETIVGYVGRLAPEKQVEDLAALAAVPGIKVAVVGDGPRRAALERLLPDAAFLGFLGGAELATAVASFDLFVHPGENETFCQTIQEALASGVPVVATGRGGPLDLVRNSVTGWLYSPGDLPDLQDRVRDLAGDTAKRRAFALAARASVEHRTWAGLGQELVGHYRDAIRLRAGFEPVRVVESAASAGPLLDAAAPPDSRPDRWMRYVALGDSLTEGLSDSSRQAPGEFRGWADRLATYLAHSGSRTDPLRYANLGVRSRRVRDVVFEQIPAAIGLGADLVTVLIGANDLAGGRGNPDRLAGALHGGVAALRASGADVLLVTPFAPHRWYLAPMHDRLARYAAALREVAADTGSVLLDFRTDPACGQQRTWSEDRVHLSSHGHRLLSYRAAEALGVPGAFEVGALDIAMHEEPGVHDSWTPTSRWLWAHARPWAMRRLQGRTAGDGLAAKHSALVVVPGRGERDRRAPVDSDLR